MLVAIFDAEVFVYYYFLNFQIFPSSSRDGQLSGSKVRLKFCLWSMQPIVNIVKPPSLIVGLSPRKDIAKVATFPLPFWVVPIVVFYVVLTNNHRHCIWSDRLENQLREGSGYQNGWIFGKVPKGGRGVILKPKIYIAEFGPSYRFFSDVLRKYCNIFFWKWGGRGFKGHLEFFRKIIRFGTATPP